MAGCRTQQSAEAPIRTVTEIRDRIVEVPAAQDSALIQMFLYCDSTNQVIMRNYDELTSKYMGVITSARPSGKNLGVTVRANTDRPPVIVTVHDTIVTTDKPIYVKGDTIEVERDLTFFQKFLQWSGGIFWALSIIIIFLLLLNPHKN